MSAAAYLARTAPAPATWGVNDCACWAATFWAEETGFDPAAHLRGTYGTWFECRRIVMARGGLLRLCRDLMAGVTPGGTGDGIAVARVGHQVICGVVAEGRLYLKADRALTSPADFTFLERWTL